MKKEEKNEYQMTKNYALFEKIDFRSEDEFKGSSKKISELKKQRGMISKKIKRK